MFRNLVRISRPLNLLLAALTYMLGVSIPAYLVKLFLFLPFWLGLIYILLAQWSMSLLAEVFRPINEPIIENETLQARSTVRNNSLYLSVGALTINVVIAYILYVENALAFPSFLFLTLALILVFLYAIPPFSFFNRGFVGLTLA